MGAAMAPAAADTITTHFRNTCTTPADYSLILTGDLGSFGSELLKDLMQKNNVDLANTYNDCALMLYDLSRPNEISASGCGCSALVFCAHIFPMLQRKELQKILFVGTGALMSSLSSQQNQSIPSIAHAVEIVS
jgi:stage V sporulation protein AD